MNSERNAETGRGKMDALGLKVLAQAKEELFLGLRYLFSALNSFEFVPDSRFPYLATDAKRIYFNPIRLCKQYEENPVLVNRAYLHMTLHCLFRSAFPKSGVNREIWDLASDIQAEMIIDEMNVRALLLPVREAREVVYARLNKKVRVFSVQNIYHELNAMPEAEKGKLIEWEMLFKVDDHDLWYRNNDQDENQQQEQQENQDKWEKEGRQVTSSISMFSDGAGNAKNHLVKTLIAEGKKQVSYADFLRKFAVSREEMHVDMDSFDYGFYAYGLSLYGDMPLIEELEYKEEARIEDLAIVLDTSGSCAGDLLQSFLNTTVKILSESESFFQNLNLHVIQCDNEIQSDTVIHSLEEAQELLSDFKAKGFGGTDFRPAFRYIENLKETGELKNLRGMIYFTDGYGTYPVSRPPFKTAFVLKGDFDPDVKVPGWAIRMNIDEDELA